MWVRFWRWLWWNDQLGGTFLDGVRANGSVWNTCPIAFNFFLFESYDLLLVRKLENNCIATSRTVAYYQYIRRSADFWSYSNKFRAVIRAFKTCSVAFIDARNGFLTKFHIEIVIQFFFSTFFFRRKKIFFWKWTKQKNQKTFFFSNFFLIIFKKHFFSTKKKVEKKNGLLFRCEILSGIHFWHL